MKSKKVLDQTKTPFLDAVERYVEKGLVPFHTPGHIQGRDILERASNLYSQPLLYDLAEVDYPEGAHDYEIARKEAEILLADLYGMERSFFLINGTTEGIHALFMAFFSQDGTQKKILLPRNSHRAAVGGLILTGAKPVWVYPEIDSELGLATVCRTEDWLEHTDVDGAFHLYPNYYGLCQNLDEQIISGVYNLVDEAHGPHLRFSERLPKSAIDREITASVQSAHKILTALTQSSWLHVKSKDAILAIERALWLIESTSPNFILWSSLDAARALEAKNPDRWDQALDRVLTFREKLKNIPGLTLFEPGVNHPEVHSFDPFKLVVSGRKAGLNGFALRDELRLRGIVPELAEPGFVLFLLTPAHTQKDLGFLFDALQHIFKGRKPVEGNTEQVFFYPRLNAHLTPKEAYFAESRKVSLRDSAGLVSVEMITPYPPGIPLLMPGEEITKEVIELIQYYKELGMQLRGFEDEKAEFIRVVAK